MTKKKKRRKYTRAVAGMTATGTGLLIGHTVVQGVGASVPASATKTAMMSSIGGGFRVGGAAPMVMGAGAVMGAVKELAPKRRKKKRGRR